MIYCVNYRIITEYASATEWQLFTEYGENERTLSELEELSNARERVTNSYS
ncbi:hypothetical protein [Microcystis aeruginosa]|uniref:Uncharacterized protein n=2 Tax=Microcystis TaxID=1125 RepID=I4G3U3_MICAE|nr:hypothetical protein [Microcystis aeruginosa]CCI02604.1 hypothetical protein MICAC_3540003 [Microcystis aeruginosa PCC 9443]